MGRLDRCSPKSRPGDGCAVAARIADPHLLAKQKGGLGGVWRDGYQADAALDFYRGKGRGDDGCVVLLM